MRLEQVTGKSKKTGKEYTAYRITIGKYKTPLFFPSEIELDYIKSYIQKQAHEEFGEDLDVDTN